MSEQPERLTEAELRALLESDWSALTDRASARVARNVVWSRRLDLARNWMLAASLLLAVQIGLDLLCLSRLQSLRLQAVTAVLTEIAASS